MILNVKAIDEVIRLADKRGTQSSNSVRIHTISGMFENFSNRQGHEDGSPKQELVNYLNGLPYDTILDLEALMILGRDGDYKETDTFEKRFADARLFFSQNYPDSSDQWRAVAYLAEKLPLADYLRGGLEAIGMM